MAGSTLVWGSALRHLYRAAPFVLGKLNRYRHFHLRQFVIVSFGFLGQGGDETEHTALMISCLQLG